MNQVISTSSPKCDERRGGTRRSGKVPHPRGSVRTNRGAIPRKPEVVKPRWEECAPRAQSNTRASGLALDPTPTAVRRAERIRKNQHRMFERRRGSALEARIRQVIQSPGVFLVSLAAIILSLGLSPLVIEDDSSSVQISPSTSVEQTNGVPGSSGANDGGEAVGS